MAKRALNTGITGQDGSYLAEHLLLADTSRVKDRLGWETACSFEVLEQDRLHVDLDVTGAGGV